jgi:hypothetical protein
MTRDSSLLPDSISFLRFIKSKKEFQSIFSDVCDSLLNYIRSCRICGLFFGGSRFFINFSSQIGFF